MHFMVSCMKKSHTLRIVFPALLSYAGGKVCLSLLGTWQGPGWTPQSTILQVLLSIQSLILVRGVLEYNGPDTVLHGTAQIPFPFISNLSIHLQSATRSSRLTRWKSRTSTSPALKRRKTWATARCTTTPSASRRCAWPWPTTSRTPRLYSRAQSVPICCTSVTTLRSKYR